MINLLQQTNYRHYLRAIFEQEKSFTNGASLNTFAKRLKLGTSSLKMILSGQRNLTSEATFRIGRILRFSRKEQMYFEALVLENQTDEPDRKAYYELRLKELREENPTVQEASFTISDNRILHHWFLPALALYLIDVEHVSSFELTQEEIERVSKRLQIPEAKLQESLTELKQVNLPATTNDEKSFHLIFNRLSQMTAEKNYLLSLLEETKRRIQTDYSKHDSYFAAYTLTIDSNSLNQLREDFKELMNKYIFARSDNRDNSRILQLNCQFFCVDQAKTAEVPVMQLDN